LAKIKKLLGCRAAIGAREGVRLHIRLLVKKKTGGIPLPVRRKERKNGLGRDKTGRKNNNKGGGGKEDSPVILHLVLGVGGGLQRGKRTGKKRGGGYELTAKLKTKGERADRDKNLPLKLLGVWEKMLRYTGKGSGREYKKRGGRAPKQHPWEEWVSIKNGNKGIKSEEEKSKKRGICANKGWGMGLQVQA